MVVAILTKAYLLVSLPEGVLVAISPAGAVTASRTRPSRGRPGTPSAGAKVGSARGHGSARGGRWWGVGPTVSRMAATEGENGS